MAISRAEKSRIRAAMYQLENEAAISRSTRSYRSLYFQTHKRVDEGDYPFIVSKD